MSNNKIKVVGYAKKIFYGDGIEYRNFSPDLVGQQFASDDGTPLFTMGNFSITTNMESKNNRTFITNKFSNFVTLSTLDLSLDQTQTLLNDNAGVILNLNKSNLNYYALFGSLTEFVRVSLEEIITKWPASLYMTPLAQASTGQILNGYTYEDYTYDSLTEISKFKINTTFITNRFQINYLSNGTIINTFNATNDLRNLAVNNQAYVVLFKTIEYPVLGFTGSTTLTNDYVYFEVKGNPFSGTTSSKIPYHIKPNTIKREEFFNELSDFEEYLLNRQVIPIYTSSFKYPIKSDDGIILYVTDTITWPVSDGYNIDFDTTQYFDYANKLVDISNDNDLYSSDLMYRFLVSESISNFDTTPVHLGPLDQDTSGQKMSKTLRIYGREFDEINKFITGIEFANVVTYDHQDNTPDVYLKNLARVLGWDLITSIIENDLLANYVTTAPSTYSGQSVGLTPVEADVELWRRIILNTPWIWKSKGARKSVEFLLRFIGAPQGLVKFNEYIYKADSPIDIELFKEALTLNGLDPDITLYPIDDDGYPHALPNTPDMYYQNNGLWYRETGGTGSTIDILTGNNPHLGPYDGGFKWINQFRSLIPNFSAVTVSSSTTTHGTTNLFINYNLGVITNYTGATYVEATNEDGSDLSDCVVVTTSIIPDPMPSEFINDCGCQSESDDDSLSICVDLIEQKFTNSCDETLISTKDNTELGGFTFSYYQYNQDGSIFVDGNNNPIPNDTYYASQECCKALGGTPWIYNAVSNQYQEVGEPTVITSSSGYICCNTTGKCGCSIGCKWKLNTTSILLPPITSTYTGVQEPYLGFTSQDGSQTLVTPDGCNCITEYTIAVPNITDPVTGQVGYACKLTDKGSEDMLLGTSSVLYQIYQERAKGNIKCDETVIKSSSSGVRGQK